MIAEDENKEENKDKHKDENKGENKDENKDKHEDENKDKHEDERLRMKCFRKKFKMCNDKAHPWIKYESIKQQQQKKNELIERSEKRTW